MPEYEVRSRHAELVAGEACLHIAPGDMIELSAEDLALPFNQRLLDEGIFVEVPNKPNTGGAE